MIDDQYQIYVVPIDSFLEQTPTTVEVFVAGCPDELNMQQELLYVGFTAVVIPVDGTHDVFADLEIVDDSNGDAVTNLVEAYNFEGKTARVMNTVYRGNAILDPGDTVNLETGITTPDTASEGAGLLVVTKLKKVMEG